LLHINNTAVVKVVSKMVALVLTIEFTVLSTTL